MSKKAQQKFYFLVIFALFQLTACFGLTNYQFSTKKKKFLVSSVLFFYCITSGLLFLILYPWSFITLLDDFHEVKTVTDYARNFTYLANAVICSFIFFSTIHIFNPSRNVDIYNKGLCLYADMCYIEGESTEKDNLRYNCKLLRCVGKTLSILLSFATINYVKYFRVFNKNNNESFFGYVLFFYLNTPSYIMALTSNRYYVVNTYFVCMMTKLNRQLDQLNAKVNKYAAVMKIKRKCEHKQKFYDKIAKQINHLMIFHSELHNVCLAFNKIYGRHVLLIIGFCFFNVVFEIYFLYVNIWTAFKRTSEIDTKFALFSLSQSIIYCAEIVYTLNLFEELAHKAEDCKKAVLKIPDINATGKLSKDIFLQVQLFSIQLLHRKFDIPVCGMFFLSNKSLFRTISSITIFITITIQFMLDEPKSAQRPSIALH